MIRSFRIQFRFSSVTILRTHWQLTKYFIVSTNSLNQAYFIKLIRSNKIQQYAGIYLLQNTCTCFGCPSHPSSGVHKAVTAASGTGRIMCQSNNLPPTWPIGHVGGRYQCACRYKDTHIVTRYVILAKHWMWLPDDGFMWTETCWSSFHNFNYFNNLRVL